jgi:hypothetical protein
VVSKDFDFLSNNLFQGITRGSGFCKLHFVVYVQRSCNFQTRGDTDLLTVLKRVVHRILPMQPWHVPFGKVLPWSAESMAYFYVVNSYVHMQQNNVAVYIPNAIELYIYVCIKILLGVTVYIF